MEAKTKQRQEKVLETTPTDRLPRRPNSLRPNSSQKHIAFQRRGSKVEGSRAPPFDQIFDLTIGPTADPIPILEEQRRDIDRIVASVNVLQQDMLSLKESVERLEDGRERSSPALPGDFNVLEHGHTKVSRSLSEVDALKLEMKMMQHRVKCIEVSKSAGRRSTSVTVSAQVSRRPSTTIDEQATPRNYASSNGLPFSAARTPISPWFDGSFAPQEIASAINHAVDRGDPSFQGLSPGSKVEALLPQKSFTTRPRATINSTDSRGSYIAVNMPPPQIRPKGLKLNTINRRSSTTSNMATPRTASTSIRGTTKSTILPRIISRMQEASTSPQYNHPEDHEYDDELVGDVHPQSSTGSSTGNYRHPASNAAQSHQNQMNENAQQPPSRTQRRKSVPMSPPTPGSSNKNIPARGRTTHHDSKRRKTTAFDASTSSTSIWADDSRDARSSSSRRDEHGPVVKSNGGIDRKSARLRGLASKGKKKPGERDEDGYLLRPDGTRNPHSVASFGLWKTKKAEAELSR